MSVPISFSLFFFTVPGAYLLEWTTDHFQLHCLPNYSEPYQKPTDLISDPVVLDVTKGLVLCFSSENRLIFGSALSQRILRPHQLALTLNLLSPVSAIGPVADTTVESIDPWNPTSDLRVIVLTISSRRSVDAGYPCTSRIFGVHNPPTSFSY